VLELGTEDGGERKRSLRQKMTNPVHFKFCKERASELAATEEATSPDTPRVIRLLIDYQLRDKRTTDWVFVSSPASQFTLYAAE
jgi:hypothetical protein